jgi:hypothetical protein
MIGSARACPWRGHAPSSVVDEHGVKAGGPWPRARRPRCDVCGPPPRVRSGRNRSSRRGVRLAPLLSSDLTTKMLAPVSGGRRVGRDYPRSQEEFRRFFSTGRACLLFLAHLRWRDGFECPACGHERYWPSRRRPVSAVSVGGRLHRRRAPCSTRHGCRSRSGCRRSGM